jgi:hypothetical protein
MHEVRTIPLTPQADVFIKRRLNHRHTVVSRQSAGSVFPASLHVPHRVRICSGLGRRKQRTTEAKRQSRYYGFWPKKHVPHLMLFAAVAQVTQVLRRTGYFNEANAKTIPYGSGQ